MTRKEAVKLERFFECAPIKATAWGSQV